MSDTDGSEGYEIEWDGGAIDGTDQWISEAPYWSDGEVVGPDRETADADGDVTTDDSGDEDGDDERFPSPDDINDIRQRLLDGESTVEMAEDYPRTQPNILHIARGESYGDLGDQADTPPLEYEGEPGHGEWVIADDAADDPGGDDGADDTALTASARDETEAEQTVESNEQVRKNARENAMRLARGETSPTTARKNIEETEAEQAVKADPDPTPTAPSPPPSARGDGIGDTVIGAAVLVVGFVAAYLLGRRRGGA